VGQDHITSVLAYEVAENKLNHAYLFCGSRGTGKTSCAKILAKAANCRFTVNGEPCNKCESCRSIDSGSSLDVLEMDAASNTGVDYIRDIREEVVFTPSEMSTRVYIIDEVHMLSEGAFNALLKTLEEPPTNVIFVLATTELQKIPATILSRCQRFDFRRISIGGIVSRLEYIASEENIALEPDAARLIARLSQGGMRDAISLLELCAGEGGKVTYDSVLEKAGVCGRESVIKIGEIISSKNYSGIFASVAEIYHSSKDISSFLNEMISLYRDMMVIRAMKYTDVRMIDPEILDVSESEFAELKSLSEKFRYPAMIYHTRLLKDAILSISRGADKRMTAEMTLMRMCSGATGDSSEALSARIGALEERLSGAAAVSTVAPSPDIKEPAPRTSRIKSAPDNNDLPAPASKEEQERKEYYDWIEIVSAFERTDAAAAPFLRKCDAYVIGSTLSVETSDRFALSFLESGKAADRVLAQTRLRGEPFTAVELKLVEKKAKSLPIDEFDD